MGLRAEDGKFIGILGGNSLVSIYCSYLGLELIADPYVGLHHAFALLPFLVYTLRTDAKYLKTVLPVAKEIGIVLTH